MEVCKYYLRGNCKNGNNCWYSHDRPLFNGKKPCKFFFKYLSRRSSGDVTCKNGDSCNFSHKIEDYLEYHNLHSCPNNGCKNYCRGEQCYPCHMDYYNTLQKEKKEMINYKE